MRWPRPIPLLLGLAGAWLCAGAAADVPPPIRIARNHRYFATEEGRPFFYLADTAWGLFSMTREHIDLVLRDRAGKGFTAIQAVAANYTGLDRPNPYGAPVFLPRAGGRLEPNPKYFENVDYAVAEANSLGMYVSIVPIWGKSYINERHSVFDPAGAAAYGRFLGARYRKSRVIYILGGDWYPEGTMDIWRALAAGIDAGGGGAQLKTFHPTGIQSSSRWFQGDTWLDFNMIQSRHMVLNRSYDLIAQDWERTPPKPVVDGESVYEGISDELVTYHPGVPLIQAWDVRRVAYCAVLAGAAGCAYGSQGVWNYTDPPPGRPAASRSAYGLPPVSLAEALARPAGSQMRYLRALIESRPMLSRIPDEWLVVNDPRSTTERIEAARAADGAYIFVYTSAGLPVRVRLRDKIYDKLSGTAYRAWWYDPRTGAATRIGEFQRTQAGDREADVHRGDITREFTPPSSGPGRDWVLVLDDAARNFPAPGTAIEQPRDAE